MSRRNKDAARLVPVGKLIRLKQRCEREARRMDAAALQEPRMGMSIVKSGQALAFGEVARWIGEAIDAL